MFIELGSKERKIYFRENWLKFLGIWGAAELFWGFGEHKQNTFRELRQKLTGIWGDQSIIFRELGSKDPPPWGGPPDGATVGMLKNAHDAVTIRYGATTVQAGSATTASISPTNVHDLAVFM